MLVLVVRVPSAQDPPALCLTARLTDAIPRTRTRARCLCAHAVALVQTYRYEHMMSDCAVPACLSLVTRHRRARE